jgi:TrmH family RNA methyltransferase
MSAQISSLQNRYVKNVVKLRKRQHRDNQRRTVIEGARESILALQKQIIPLEAYICPAYLDEEAEGILASLHQLASEGRTWLFEVTPDVFAKIVYRDRSGGLLLVIPYLNCALADLSIGHNPLLVVVENVEKPGNLGAILRSADGAGADGVIVSTSGKGAGTDLHNPNVVRASLGALFAVPVATTLTNRLIDWLQKRGIRIVIASPSASLSYTDAEMTGPIALVLGSEASGLSAEWLSAADEQVVVPMRGAVDSLNLAVSSALLLYEAVRQRESTVRRG